MEAIRFDASTARNRDRRSRPSRLDAPLVCRRRGRAWILALVASGCVCASAWGETATVTQTLNPIIGPLGKLAVVQSTVNLTHAGTIFNNFTGSVAVQYKIRTTISTGSSSITLQASPFVPATGPSIAGGDLTYTCGGATVGSNCSGTQTVRSTSQTNVVTIGSGACTGAGCAGANPDSVTINLTLVDSPVFKTGRYSTTFTFSISAL